ncbi:MAG: redoxin domain-containing protein [Alistipes sp.]|nr:redoxin domain-containing protein [Alistipes sp.]
MKRLLYAIAAVAILFSSCSQKSESNTSVSGRFVGSGVDSVYLERISDKFDKSERVAGVQLAEDGAFNFDFNVAEGEEPRFYRLTFANKCRPVTLVVASGDEIKLESAGNIFLNYRVEGSEESALIAEFCHDYFAEADELANIADILLRESGRDAKLERRAYDLARNAMLAQVRFVGSHQSNLASIYALRHRVAEQYIPQLDGQGVNIVHYRSVLEGIKEAYPNSPYIAILERNIAESEAVARLIEEVAEVNYPELELTDIYGTKHKLSDLEGKVVLLYFWSALNPMCNNHNADLKSLYEKYHDKGFEVYHVSVDGDKQVWIEATTAQKLPWPTLYTAGDVRVVDLYNVVKIPTTYIISRKGDIAEVAENVKDIEREVKRLL